MRIVLASASPRRRELLRQIISEFYVEPSQIDEGSTHKTPAMLARDVAGKKGVAAYAATDSPLDSLVISADTVVYGNGKVYGKPTDATDAVRIIKELNGKRHAVYTAVFLIFKGKTHSFVAKSKVKFKALSDAEIENYVEEYKPLDKAGAYGIQDGVLVEAYKGSNSNIMGLPVERLKKKLAVLEKLWRVKIINVPSEK